MPYTKAKLLPESRKFSNRTAQFFAIFFQTPIEIFDTYQNSTAFSLPQGTQFYLWEWTMFFAPKLEDILIRYVNISSQKTL